MQNDACALAHLPSWWKKSANGHHTLSGAPVGHYPDNMPLISACQVIGPTMPSTATEGTSSDTAC